MTRESLMLHRFATTAALVGFALAGGLPNAVAQVPGCPPLPPDSVVQVKMLQQVDSRTNAVGDTFDAEVVRQISADGKLLATSPAPAKVRLVRVLQPNQSPTDPVLALKLVEINPHGTACAVVTGVGELSSGLMKVNEGNSPPGSASEGAVDQAITEDNHLGQSAGAVINGAGVSFELASGHEVIISKDATLNFEVANLASLR